MAQKIFLNRQKANPTTQVPTISRKHTDPAIASSSKNILGSGTSVQLPFRILDETTKSFPKFNETGRSLLIKFDYPGEEQEPTAYLRECITSLTNYLVSEVSGRNLVGLRIRNTENVQDKEIGISLRRCDQLNPFRSDVSPFETSSERALGQMSRYLRQSRLCFP